MKKIKFLAAAFLGLVINVNAQELPVPSPYAEVEQRVGLTDIEVEYSRPGVKGRVIFGDLEPFDQVWRTGANAATKITFTTDVNFGGVDVEMGTYSIVSIPGKTEWKVMLNTDLNVQEGSYKEENNVAVVSVEGMRSEFTESMLFTFDNVKDESVDFIFQWENSKWIVPIKVNAKDAAIKNIEAKLSEIENAFRPYNSSARYYLDAGLDLEKALMWSKKSVEMDARFWNVYTLSLIYEAIGDKKNAIKTAERSLDLAVKAEYQPYIKMNKDNIAKWSK